ncbi:hypothetical protein yrohd0001_18530, partial [Yersinia rohdei ATCC 43380]
MAAQTHTLNYSPPHSSQPAQLLLLSPTNPPASPAANVASALTVCFCFSVRLSLSQ